MTADGFMLCNSEVGIAIYGSATSSKVRFIVTLFKYGIVLDLLVHLNFLAEDSPVIV